jgi:RNA polymerase sigma-70 factor (ECF subfamily)
MLAVKDLLKVTGYVRGGSSPKKHFRLLFSCSQGAKKPFQMNHINDSFMRTLEPFSSDLYRYCRMMTGTPWDADDLYQETLMKAYQASISFGEHPAPKAYLFRIATNAWIDQCRKNKYSLDTYEDEHYAVKTQNLAFDIREAMEELLCHLPPRQLSILLLIDVFEFDVRSASVLMDMTEGALKAALHRARTTLKQVKQEEGQVRSSLKLKSVPELVDIFLAAFQRHDPVAVSRAYYSLKHHGVDVKRVARSGAVSFQFEDPDGNVFTVVAEA